MLSETGVHFIFFFPHLAALAQLGTEIAQHVLYPSRFYNLNRDSFFWEVKFAQLLTIWKIMEQKEKKEIWHWTAHPGQLSSSFVL